MHYISIHPVLFQELKDKKDRILYGLYAVVIHSGTTLKSGHYVAYVKTRPKRSTDTEQLLSLRSTQFKYNFIRKQLILGNGIILAMK